MHRMYSDSTELLDWVFESYLTRRMFTKQDIAKFTCPVILVRGSDDAASESMKGDGDSDDSDDDGKGKEPSERAQKWMVNGERGKLSRFVLQVLSLF